MEIIGHDGKWFGALGRFKITDAYDNKEQVENLLSRPEWKEIISVVIVLIEAALERERESK